MSADFFYMTSINPLAVPLERALADSEQLKTRVYQAEDAGIPLPDMVSRARLVDEGRYVYRWEQSCGLRHHTTSSIRYYRLVFVETGGQHNVSTRDMLGINGLHRTIGHASLVELVRFFMLHHKVAMEFLKRGKTFAGIGYDMFRSSYDTYPEITLNENGAPALRERRLSFGTSWSANHILLMRADPAT